MTANVSIKIYTHDFFSILFFFLHFLLLVFKATVVVAELPDAVQRG